MDYKIEVFPKDPEDGCFCAILMTWHEPTQQWVNTGIVSRSTDVVTAFKITLGRARQQYPSTKF